MLASVESLILVFTTLSPKNEPFFSVQNILHQNNNPLFFSSPLVFTWKKNTIIDLFLVAFLLRQSLKFKISQRLDSIVIKIAKKPDQNSSPSRESFEKIFFIQLVPRISKTQRAIH
jgi:hypothetical protein